MKNPFSLYDFLGYLIPGAIASYIVLDFRAAFITETVFCLHDYCSISIFTEWMLEYNEYDVWKMIIPFVLISYVFGHLLSYLSAIIIEPIITRNFGYPSKYLLAENRETIETAPFFKKESDNHSEFEGVCFINLYRLCCALLILPIVILVLCCGKSFGIQMFLFRPLDPDMIRIINQKLKELKIKLGIDENLYSNCSDFHRIVMHYVYQNIPESQKKTDNFIALYGFLRSMTLIVSLTFDVLFFLAIVSVVVYWGESFDYQSFITIIILFFSSFFLFMAFAKFYRRYTLENYMVLVSDVTLAATPSMKVKESLIKDNGKDTHKGLCVNTYLNWLYKIIRHTYKKVNKLCQKFQ